MLPYFFYCDIKEMDVIWNQFEKSIFYLPGGSSCYYMSSIGDTGGSDSDSTVKV